MDDNYVSKLSLGDTLTIYIFSPYAGTALLTTERKRKRKRYMHTFKYLLLRKPQQNPQGHEPPPTDSKTLKVKITNFTRGEE